MFSLSSSSHSLCFCSCHGQCRTEKIPFLYDGVKVSPRIPQHLHIFSSLRRRNPKKSPKSSPAERKLEMVIDLEDISNQASMSLRRFFRSSESRFREFVSAGAETFADLQTLVTFDRKGRMVVACRRSSLEFLANLTVLSFILVFAVRVLVKLGLRSGLGNWDMVRRRDRSLAGREVVVGKRIKERGDFMVSVNPLSYVRATERRSGDRVLDKRRVSKKETLPSWWPNLITKLVGTVEKESQREAGRLIRAIMDNRMSGKDLTEDDIIQLRRICRTSGVKVSIETANARDSLYRASVDFVLNTCSNAMCQPNLVHIDGEELRQFVAGFADNIGLEDARAATIVCAAVAARTRSRFLQAWAFEIQGKRSEALDELLKICAIHQIFPPEEYSPEMEMVARGLEKHLKLEQREHLLKLLEGVCRAENQRIAVEALGLFVPPKDNGDMPASRYL
ncbi:uncharacterized protein LOC131240066 [Magnolia sinica]|uniref:uncharacterized protein LOC131240066 n=1 Tax=Magnolia sinica TaxID=86752 RepID=UPI00265935C5|nr:uncharacterized protein LOC131240066 [Magnolia sinica]